MKAFRALTSLLIVSALAALVLHFPLLASDSATYRGWVYLQMLSLGAVAALLWHVRKMRVGALFGFLFVSASLVYVNATFINYGKGAIIWFAPIIFVVAYSAVAAGAFRRFRTPGDADGA